MKRLLLLVVAATLFSTSSGCCLLDRILCCRHWGCPWEQCDDGCASCGDVSGEPGFDGSQYAAHAGGCTDGSCGTSGWQGRRPTYGAVNPGPPSGAVTYPYYTNRGPRDFLARNPRSIGPN